jgi:uridine kinase
MQFIFFSLQILVLVRDITSGNASEFGLGFENQLILNTAFTFSAVLGFSWALSNLAKLVNKSDILKLNRKPLLVAIAGNSGVGKDTFADSLSTVFGEKNVSFLTGDGYHKYERGNGRWQTKTHLNPEQNRLAEWKVDIDKALNRKPILKAEYDHSIGRFTPQLILKPKDFVISQGLHALDSEISKYADLKVFMEMDEEIRLRLKVLRDTSKRGRSLQSIRSEMHKRRKDYRSYILPQRDLADIVIKQSGKVRADEVEISSLMLEIKDVKYVDLLAKVFLPYFPNLQLRINGYESGQIHFNSISTMSSETIYVILKTNLESFSELSIKREQLKSGALGIATAASLLYLEYRRRQVGKFDEV